MKKLIEITVLAAILAALAGCGQGGFYEPEKGKLARYERINGQWVKTYEPPKPEPETKLEPRKPRPSVKSTLAKPVTAKPETKAAPAVKAVVPDQSEKKVWVARYEKAIATDNRRLSKEVVSQIANTYYGEEEKYGLPHGLLIAIGWKESNHRTNCMSGSGACGIMQVKADLWSPEKVGVKTGPSLEAKRRALFDPITNVRTGAFVINYYIRKNSGDLNKALHGYSLCSPAYNKAVLGFMVKVANS